jgi:hypothetical protein
MEAVTQTVREITLWGGDSRSRVLLIGGANDKLRGSAEGLPEGEPFRGSEGDQIVKLETKRNETKRNGTGFLAPWSRRDQSAYFSHRPTSLVHEKSRCDDYSSTQFDSERGRGGEVK